MTGPKQFKLCKACQQSKPVDEFYRRSNGYLSAWCRPCTTKANSRRKTEQRRLAREARLALPQSELKTCTQCGEPKARSEFYGSHAECKECFTARQRAYAERPEVRERNARRGAEYRERTRPLKRIRTLARYGISPEHYDEMFDAQGGRCAICRTQGLRMGTGGEATRNTVLCVDHAHDETNRIRGLLCQSCNRGIGLLGDDIDRLQSAINYLRSN